ncbi:hypothetical protein [Vibrio sp. F74]|uniref:hypothetical protein n=1 Tax=Vibrio sp. F74 TaxID=700020 RepID=UPI0035F552F2
MVKKIIFVILIVITLVIVAGIVRFNFTNDDIYVVEADGQVVPFETSNDTNVMLTLFNFKTDNYWQVQLPDSDAEVRLTDIKEYDGFHLAIGEYQDGEEYGLVGVDYYKITTLNLKGVDEEMVFSAPFSVSNQGSGVFWYLGLFKLNMNTAEVRQMDAFFLGDRIKITELKPDEPFDITSSLLITYFKHSQTQSMADKPNVRVGQRLKVSMEGFSE